MDVEIVGHAAVDENQERAKLLGPVPVGEIRDDLARGDAEGGMEVGCAVADVVVSAPFWETGPEWEHRLGAVQGRFRWRALASVVIVIYL